MPHDDAHRPIPRTPGLRRRTAIGGLMALPLATGVAAAREAAAPLPTVGGSLPLAEVPLFGGGSFRPAQAQGQVLVVYWWASWCPFCAVQTPDMQKLWSQHRGRGLQLLGLSIDRRAEDAQRYMQQRGYTFPSGHLTPALAQAMPKPGKSLPVTCVIGRDGRVAMVEDGQVFPEDIEQITRFL